MDRGGLTKEERDALMFLRDREASELWWAKVMAIAFVTFLVFYGTVRLAVWLLERGA